MQNNNKTKISILGKISNGIYILTVTLFSAIALPVLAATPKDFKDLINNTLIAGILKPLVPFLIGLAVVMFIYGVLILIFSEGGEKSKEGKQYMLWGIVGIFVMVSVWGLVNILISTFQLSTTPQTIKMEVPNAEIVR